MAVVSNPFGGLFRVADLGDTGFSVGRAGTEVYHSHYSGFTSTRHLKQIQHLNCRPQAYFILSKPFTHLPNPHTVTISSAM